MAEAIIWTLSSKPVSLSRMESEYNSLPETQPGSQILNLPMFFSMAAWKYSSLSHRQSEGSLNNSVEGTEISYRNVSKKAGSSCSFFISMSGDGMLFRK